MKECEKQCQIIVREKVTSATSVLNIMCTPSIVLVSRRLSRVVQLCTHIMGEYNIWIYICVCDNKSDVVSLL